MNNVYILIPSLDPDEKLVEYIRGLLEEGIKKDNIIIVNDGSRVNTEVFERLKNEKIKVLSHAVNRGKGRALKTGFEYILKTFSAGEVAGVVTADADGQHSPTDTARVCKELERTNGFILGTRNLQGDNVPFKSKFGNTVTTLVFWSLYGKKIMDTQTGLRGIPYNFLERCINFKGERFDYEIVMLIEAAINNLNIVQLPIETIYIDSNRATHFNAIKDSWRIYRILLKRGVAYAVSSMIGAMVDLTMFTALTNLLFMRLANASLVILWSTVIARAVSNIVNFSINRNKVFAGRNSLGKSAVRYATLAIVQMLLSWFFVDLLFSYIPRNTTVLKVIVDTCLFFASYYVQRRWVFNVNESRNI